LKSSPTTKQLPSSSLPDFFLPLRRKSSSSLPANPPPRLGLNKSFPFLPALFPPLRTSVFPQPLLFRDGRTPCDLDAFLFFPQNLSPHSFPFLLHLPLRERRLSSLPRNPPQRIVLGSWICPFHGQRGFESDRGTFFLPSAKSFPPFDHTLLFPFVISENNGCPPPSLCRSGRLRWLFTQEVVPPFPSSRQLFSFPFI